MRIVDVVMFLVSTLLAAALTGVARAFALKCGIMDVPNARSSHQSPTPRGGGIAIAVTVIGGSLLLISMRVVETSAALPLTAGALVAAIGYIDDRRGLPALPRFIAQLGASVLALATIPSAAVSFAQPWFEWSASAAIVIAITWSTNLFNFMDGIDGLAASQAVFVSVGSAALLAIQGNTDVASLALVTGGACLGFLLWNWPPAKIFMGDVGSGFLGFWLAVHALWVHAEGALDIWTSVILGCIFVADATATLLVRVVRRLRWHEAHRSHVYQRLARSCRSHAKVTAGAWVLNLTLVFPLAIAAELKVLDARATAIVLTASLILFAVLIGAGREEAPDRAV